MHAVELMPVYRALYRSAGYLLGRHWPLCRSRTLSRSFTSNEMDPNGQLQGGSDTVQAAIVAKLQDRLKPSHLEVINESNMHNVPKGSETHFKVVVVSSKFHEMPLIKRHRLVMDTLKAEMERQVRALSIQAKTPDQWESCEGKVAQSPPCLGGSKR